MSFQMINLHTNLHYIIANLLPSWHLHFGTGLKCIANLIFHPVNCTILGYQTAELPPRSFGEKFLVALGSASLFKQLKFKSAPNL